MQTEDLNKPCSVPRNFDEASDWRSCLSIVTNGHLIEKYFNLLLKTVKVLNVSLNAACPETHHRLMGMGRDSFERIIALTKALNEQRGIEGVKFHAATLSFVVNRYNIHEVPDFISLGEELGVATVYFRTLIPMDIPVFGVNYQSLPPSLIYGTVSLC